MRKRELVERVTALEGYLESTTENYVDAKERLVELELALEDVGWNRLTGEGGQELSREAIRKITGLALLHYVKNPITNHGVEVQGHYVFGQGVTITGESDEVDRLWKLFWNDPGNRSGFTSPTALFSKEVDLQLEGSLFLALFTSTVTGAVRIRSIHSNEIADIITNPEDAQEPWFYRRVWSERRMSEGGNWTETAAREALYPAWNYRPKVRPTKMWGLAVNWDAPIYHVKVGGPSHMRFGVPEIYCALDWARAAKEAMEDYATVRKALAMFAHSLTVKGGSKGVTSAKAKLGTKYGASETSGDTSPAPVKGSTFLGAEGWKLDVVRTSGAQSHPEEARFLFMMAGAGHGLPYSILTGDADKSNLATAKSLDRPTELRMQMRRMLWSTVFRDLATYLVTASVRAAKGVLNGKIVADEWGTERVDLGKDDEGNPIPAGVTVEWPSILEHDVTESVTAIVSAATLDGKADAGTIPRETLVRQLGTALRIEDVDAMVDELLAEDEEAPSAENLTMEAKLTETLRELREWAREQAA